MAPGLGPDDTSRFAPQPTRSGTPALTPSHTLTPAAIERMTLIYAIGNISSSVALVLVNKVVFAEGFKFPMSLTALHFGFTVLFYRALAALGVFEHVAMPAAEAFKVAAAGVGSIGFMNISLNLNSVGFYQITKLAIVPCTLVMQLLLYNTHTSRKVQASLLVLLVGLAWATVTDVHLNAPGFVLGVFAVVTSAVFQIWQGAKQKEYGLSGTQLQSAVAFWQFMQSLAASLALENLCVQFTPQDVCPATAVGYVLDAAESAAQRRNLLYVLLTCGLALTVNCCSFGLIGRTSPTTYQARVATVPAGPSFASLSLTRSHLPPTPAAAA